MDSGFANLNQSFEVYFLHITFPCDFLRMIKIWSMNLSRTMAYSVSSQLVLTQTKTIKTIYYEVRISNFQIIGDQVDVK